MNNIKTIIIAAILAYTFAPAINIYAMGPTQTYSAEATKVRPARTPKQVERANDDLVKAIVRQPTGKEATEKAIAALEAGADATASTETGRPFIELAATYNHVEIVKMLLTHQANVNATNETGETPLFLVSNKLHKDTIAIVQILLARNATVNHQDDRGDTALMACTKTCSFVSSKADEKIKLTVAQLLIFADANPYLVDKDGGNALSRGSETIKHGILDALATKEQAYKQVDTLKTLLHLQILQNSYIPVDELAQLIIDYAVPYYAPDKNNQSAYDFLNKQIMHRWACIK